MKPINIFSAVAFILCCTVELSSISAQSLAVNDNSQKLSGKDSVKVKSILSHYCNRLNSDDARAITSSFRSAGLQNGPALKFAIQQAGFDPELLYRLAAEQNHSKSF
jgi:hypothetical protein